MSPRPARGLLDLLLAVLCLWTAGYHTPVGALVRRSVAWACGRTSTARPLLAYYEGVSGSGVSAPVLAPDAPPPRGFLEGEALAYGTHLALKGLSPAARAPAFALAREVGLTPESLLDPIQGPPAARRLHAALAEDFPEEETRLAALFAGRAPARYAIERLRAEGGAPSLTRLARSWPPGFEEAAGAVAQTLALSTAFALAWPVPESTRVTSPFGYRISPVLGVRKLHTGVDLAVREGTEVHVVADGTVRRASEDSVNGRVLIIDHGHGVTTAYCHNSELRVLLGQHVKRGELISLSGNTGRSTGPHLHYQLALSAQPVDPMRFRPGPPSVVADTDR